MLLSLLFGTAVSASATIGNLLETKPGQLDLHVASLQETTHEHHKVDNSTNIISQPKLHTFRGAAPDWLSPSCLWTPDQKIEYCQFTHVGFENGRGISIITRPEVADRMLELPAFKRLTFEDSGIDLREQNFKIDQFSKKGLGSISKNHITMGTVINEARPILMIDSALYENMPDAESYQLLQKVAIDSLPKTTRTELLNLYGGTGKNPAHDRLMINSFVYVGWPHDEDPVSFHTVYNRFSRLNHDCRANAAVHFDFENLTQSLHSVRGIAAGEEITISYEEMVKTREDRASLLGFDCQCSACQAKDHLSHASDDRISEILHIQEKLGDKFVAPAGSTALAELLISLYHQERLDLSLWRPYALSAYEWNGVGDIWRARERAHQALASALVCNTLGEGEIDDIKSLLSNQKQHWSWNYRKDSY